MVGCGLGGNGVWCTAVMGRIPTTRKRRAELHPYVLYTAAVQNVDSDLDFARGAYRRANGRAARRLREDFCGTACWPAPGRAAPGPGGVGHRIWMRTRWPRGTRGVARAGPRGGAGPPGAWGCADGAHTAPMDIVIALIFPACSRTGCVAALPAAAHAALAPGGVLVMDVSAARIQNRRRNAA